MSSPEMVVKRIAVLNRDVFLGVRLKQLGRELGYEVAIAPDAGTFLETLISGNTALGIVDINARPDWSIIAAGIQGSHVPPILAFGPHLDVDGLRKAKAAGVTRVVSNGTFHRDAAKLIARYASENNSVQECEATDELENL